MTDLAAVERIAEFLSERDKSVLPGEANDAERIASAQEILRIATPSSPVSAPSPAGGVREALANELLRIAKVGFGYDINDADRKVLRSAAAALSSPATGEVVEALKATRSIVSDGAMVGFNCHDGDWAERLYKNQAQLSTLIRALNPAPGHGEGGL